jgi:cystathionine beta-lyase
MVFDRAFFDAGIDRSGTQSVKWSSPGITLSGAIPLWVADMDFAAAPAIAQALTRRAQHANYGYTYMDDGDTEALCAYWLRHHGVKVSPRETGLLPSVVSGLRACVTQMTAPGDGVIVQSPVYGPFFAVIKDSGRRVLEAPLLSDAQGRYTMDLAAVEQYLKEGARLMLLCSPHNPVARAWDEEELVLLMALLNGYGCALVSDEIHADFVYKPRRFISVLALDQPGMTIVSLASASKTYNVAGLQQASIFCRDPDLMKAIGRQLHICGVEAGNVFALVATRAAYTQCDDWLAGVLAYLDDNRQMMREDLGRLLPEAILSPIEATYLAWVDMRAYGFSNAELYARCRQALVLPTDGTFFGKQCGEGYMRLNFGCPATQLMTGLERFAKAVKG